jgi:hypothetical protein
MEDISTDQLKEEVQKMYKETWDRDKHMKETSNKIVVETTPQELPIELRFDKKARFGSEELAKVMDESFTKAVQSTVRNVNQSTVLWTTVGELNPGGFQSEDRMNSQFNDWRVYLYNKKKNGDLNRLSGQIGELMGDPRVYESMTRYKIENAKTLKDKYPSKNSLRMLARTTTSETFFSTLENVTEKTERGARKYTDLAFFKVNAGGSGTDWVMSVFIRILAAADVLVLGMFMDIYVALPLGILLTVMSLLTYVGTLLMKLTNTQFFDFTLAIIGKMPKIPTATVLVGFLEKMLDKLYPHMKPLYPIIRLLLKFTQPIWNSIMSYIMGVITQGSKKLIDFINPSDYAGTRTTESVNAILLRFIRLYLYISRSIEEGLVIYCTLVMKLLWGIVKWVIKKVVSLIG